MDSIVNGWEQIDFAAKDDVSKEVFEAAKLLMSKGFLIGNPAKGVSAEYRSLTNESNFNWGQIVISYKKSMVSAPYFVAENGQIYVLYNHNFQPAAGDYFNETARGFATTVNDKVETTMETALRIIKQKTNLPAEESMIFRTSAPINTDPSWNQIPDGLSFIGCRMPTEWFKWNAGVGYSVKENYLIDINKSQPKIATLDDFLSFDENIESIQQTQCGLSRHAVLALLKLLGTKCPKCNNTGKIWTASSAHEKICSCEHGLALLKEINEDKAICPECNNSGLGFFFEPNSCRTDYFYCSCKHGDELKKKTKEKPATCPVCHGTKRYDPIEDKDNFGDQEIDCICTKL